MMDYFGSIVKSESEIDAELIQRFRDRCHESLMKKIIQYLRKEQVLLKEYSVSGWNVFHGRHICEKISSRINFLKTEQRIKLLYCYNQLFDEHEIEICRMICDKI